MEHFIGPDGDDPYVDRTDRTTNRVLGVFLALLVIVIAFIVWSHWNEADAHEAPSGWRYPISCCSNFDCREVADAAIIEGPDGITIAATGELIPHGDRKLRDSPDGVFHWCSVGGREDSKTICLFVPPRGF